MSPLGDIRIGISGWRYKPWRGTFYPSGLAQRRELEYASARLNSIELNGSFYSLQRPGSFARWYEETPPNFIFSIKGSRFVTHMRKLLDVETPMANFFAQGLLRLGDKLGPVLWQFPPNFKCDLPRLQRFFKLLPRTHEQAARLARKHDERLDGRSWFRVRDDRHLRHAIEIRNESFVCEEFIALLRENNVALVVADTVEWPLLMDITADFIYIRLHGSEQLYTSGYDQPAIGQWARRITSWAQGSEVSDGRNASAIKAPLNNSRDVYVYFDNDAKVRAPFDALALQAAIANLKTEQVTARQHQEFDRPDSASNL